MDPLDALLSQVKDEYGPDAAAKQRVRAALSVSLAAGSLVASSSLAAASAPATSSTVASSAVGSAAGSGGALSVAPLAAGTAAATAGGKGLLFSSLLFSTQWGKAVVGLALVSGVTGVGVGVAKNWPAASDPQAQAVNLPTLPVAPTRQPESNAVVAQRLQPSGSEIWPAERSLEPVAAAPSPSVSSAQDTRNDAPSARRSSSPAPRAASAPNNADGPSNTLAELSLLRTASVAFRAGDTNSARRALTEHQRRYRHSALAPERQGLSLLVNCTDGVSAGDKAAAQRFITAAPTSPLADAIKKQCLP